MKTPNERLREVRNALKVSQLKFAEISRLSLSTVQKIENQTMEVSEKNLQILKDTLNVNPDFVRTGKGEKFIEGMVPDISQTERSSENPYKDALVKELKDQVTYLQEMLRIALSGKPANFLKALNNAGFSQEDLLGAAA